MRHALALLLGALLLPVAARAQTYATVCATQAGEALLTCLRAGYTPTAVYSYDRARDTLFSYVDDGDRTRITDLYVGRVLPIRPGFDPTQEGCNGDKDNNTSTCSGSRTINTEHLWPQSLGAQTGRPEGDMHHLYPSRGDVNTVRSNYPFGQLGYRTAANLYRDTLTFAATAASADSLTFSAYRSSVFMPRAVVRGDIARALFYFRTIYATEATAAPERVAFFDGMKTTLLAWHRADPPGLAEQARGQRVAIYQGRQNPYALDTSLVMRAFFPGTLPVELLAFTAAADGGAAVLRWTTESETNNSGFAIETLRGSAAAAAWAELAFVAGRGTTSERAAYEQRIDGLGAGTHRFRLVQRDLDGTATVAGTVEVSIGMNAAIVAEGRGPVVRFGARDSGTLTAEAYDVTGRRVAVLFTGPVEGGEVREATLTGVAAGVYFVRVTGQMGAETARVVVR